MDEPFKGVHPELKQKLMDYILKYRQEKKGLFLFVTHTIGGSAVYGRLCIYGGRTSA